MRSKHFLDRTFAFYILFGLINTAVTTVIIFVLYNIWHWGYWPSTAVGYAAGNITSFVLNRYVTFKYKGNLLKTAVKFVLSAAASYVIAYAVAMPLVTGVMSHFGWDTVLSEEIIKIVESLRLVSKDFIEERITGNISIIVGGVIYCFINYAGQKYVVFRDRDNKTK